MEYKQKSYIFCLFLPNYYLAIASGARNLVASERKWQEVSEISFRNGMTIAIGPKNEASTLKSLKLAKIKDFTK